MMKWCNKWCRLKAVWSLCCKEKCQHLLLRRKSAHTKVQPYLCQVCITMLSCYQLQLHLWQNLLLLIWDILLMMTRPSPSLSSHQYASSNSPEQRNKWKVWARRSLLMRPTRKSIGFYTCIMIGKSRGICDQTCLICILILTMWNHWAKVQCVIESPGSLLRSAKWMGMTFHPKPCIKWLSVSKCTLNHLVSSGNYWMIQTNHLCLLSTLLTI